MVLGSDDVERVERLHDAAQADIVIADVLVGDHQPLVSCPAYAGEDAAHLAVRGLQVAVQGDMRNEMAPSCRVQAEDAHGGAVHDHHVEPLRQPGEVRRQVGEAPGIAEDLPTDGQDVGRRESLAHGPAPGAEGSRPTATAWPSQA